jgi:hypothetical protein
VLLLLAGLLFFDLAGGFFSSMGGVGRVRLRRPALFGAGWSDIVLGSGAGILMAGSRPFATACQN